MPKKVKKSTITQKELTRYINHFNKLGIQVGQTIIYPKNK